MSISGKVALLSGGAGAIGLGIAELFLEHNAKRVALLDISKENGAAALNHLQRFGPQKVLFIQTDVTNDANFDNAFRKTVDVFHQLDIVVNGAGIIDEINWSKCININLEGTLRGCYLAQKYLPEYRSGLEGVLLNIASVAGLENHGSLPAYCTTNHVIVSLGQSLASPKFYDLYQVKIITLCPGVVDTPLINDPGLRERALFSEMMEKSIESQRAGTIAETVVKILQVGTNGSVWVKEQLEPMYEVQIPNKISMKKME